MPPTPLQLSTALSSLFEAVMPQATAATALAQEMGVNAAFLASWHKLLVAGAGVSGAAEGGAPAGDAAQLAP